MCRTRCRDNILRCRFAMQTPAVGVLCKQGVIQPGIRTRMPDCRLSIHSELCFCRQPARLVPACVAGGEDQERNQTHAARHVRSHCGCLQVTCSRKLLNLFSLILLNGTASMVARKADTCVSAAAAVQTERVLHDDYIRRR